MKNIYNEDLKIFSDRKNEETISFEDLIKKLKVEGKLMLDADSDAQHRNQHGK